MHPNQLTFTNRNGAGPSYNFMDSKNYTIEFDLVELPTGGGDWLSLAFGKNVTISGPNSAGSGMGILFREGGAYSFFDDENIQVSATAPVEPNHVLVSISMEDDESTKTAIFVNSKPLKLGGAVSVGPDNPLIYRKPSGFDDNNISFYNFDTPMAGKTGVIDNLTINSTSSGFFEFDWTDDATSKISTNKNYTHKINLADDDDVTVNDVIFTGSGANFSGANWSLINGFADNNFQRLAVSGTTISGNGANFVSDCFYENYNQSSAIILSGLVPEQNYALTFYNRGSGTDLRESFFAPSDSSSAMVTLDQNASGTSGKLVKYFYKAPSNGIFSTAISTKDTAGWYYYAFSNEESAGPPPNNVSASRGTYSDKVVVSWDKVDGAEKYQVWRNTTDDSTTAITNSSEIVTNVFDDIIATPDVDYYYWVKAKNINGWSEVGESTLGFCTDSTGPDQPTNISPTNNAIVSDFPIMLVASDYSDLLSWPMISVQWQIDNRTTFSSPTYDSEELFTNATTITVPSGMLVLTNYWRVRYKNNRNKWSEWSDYTLFIAERDFDSPFYFYETFNNVSGSGDVSKDYYVSGRQLGFAAPTEYSIIGSTEIGDVATNPNKLTLSGAVSACSPNISFKEFSNFKIDVEIEPSASGTAITFGKSSQNLAPNSAGGMAFVFYGDGSGKYEVYDSDALIGGLTMTNDALKANSFHLTISVGAEEFESEAKVSAFVNGEPLALQKFWYVATNLPPQFVHIEEMSWKYKLVHSKGGFHNNYITFYNLGGNAVFDNLKIQGTVTNLATYHWTDDDDSRISSAHNYTHKVNLQDVVDVTIDGQIFVASGTGNSEFVELGSAFLAGPNWRIKSGGSEKLEIDYQWDKPPINDPPGDHTLVTGTAKDLLNHIIFNKSGSIQIQLDVTPNSSNVFVLHSSGWFTGGHQFLFSANDGGPPSSADMSMYGQNNGCIVEYKYKAPADGKFVFTLTTAEHPVFAFSNYEITSELPAISTISLLDFGELITGETKTFQLPIFNIGAGTVSGEVSGILSPFSFSDGSNYSAKSESPDFVNITFTPLADDAFSNMVTLTGSGGSTQIELKGIGVPEGGMLLWIIDLGFLVYFVFRKK